jgi:hypothetical protein
VRIEGGVVQHGEADQESAREGKLTTMLPAAGRRRRPPMSMVGGRRKGCRVNRNWRGIWPSQTHSNSAAGLNSAHV